MADHYVDLGTIGAWDTRDGATSGACWYGLSGLQNAFDHCGAGDVCYIKGMATMASSGVVGNFYSVAYDADNDTSLTNGEEVNWDTGTWTDGSSGSGIVHITSSTATSPGTVEIEMKTGTAPTEDAEIKGVTSGGIITPTAAITQKGLDVDTNAGSNASGLIKFIGVNSSWAQDGTRATISANSQGVHIITYTTTPDYTYYENIRVTGAGGSAKHGFYFSTQDTRYCTFVNCRSDTNSGAGWGGTTGYLQFSNLVRCRADLNTVGGFMVCSTCHFAFCIAQDNTMGGISLGNYGSSMYGCVIDDNTANGLTASGCNAFYNSVINNNYSGVNAGTSIAGSLFIGNRITNNSAGSTAGFYNNNDPNVLGWNYFENNYGDNIQSVTNIVYLVTPGTSTNSNLNLTSDADTDTNQGYVSSTHGSEDFSTNYVSGSDPQLRRTAITIPAS